MLNVVNCPKFMVFDLDKTLLNVDEVLSPRTRRMLQGLSAAGIPWTVATGRSPGKLVITGITELVELPIVCATGAVTVRAVGDRVERLPESEQLTPDVIAATIARVLSEHPQAVFGVDRFEILVCGPGYPALPDWVTASAVERLEQLADEPGDVLRVWAPGAQSLAASGWDVVQWRDIDRRGYIEAVAAGTSKTNAIAKLAAELGVAREEVWMFGDAPNDVDLLQWAGTGFAMRDAAAPAVAVAEAMTVYGHDEDGVARCVEALLDGRVPTLSTVWSHGGGRILEGCW